MEPALRHTFPPHLRLKSPAQFKSVYDRKKSVSDARLIVYAGPNDLPHPRVGLSVSKKVGGAVVRNRYKRLFREAFRLTQHELPAGVDFILIPRPGDVPTLEQVQESLLKLAHQGAKKLASGGRQPPGATLTETEAISTVVPPTSLASLEQVKDEPPVQLSKETEAISTIVPPTSEASHRGADAPRSPETPA